MYSFVVTSVLIFLSNHCQLSSADVCSYTLTRDCAFIPDDKAVCGTDGITYRNTCFLAKAYCADNSIHKAHDGACAKATTAAMTSPRTTAPTMTAATSDPLSVICGVMDHVHCATDIEPVCGSDDRTYVNSCEFHKEVCVMPALTVKHIGFC
ncbi:ovomucoid-like [Mercenaria mercenaria]|uniref:ovomucoid-like n=1 Tax=Mercenaria mercenaria TaxID=6596 RepID=UPI001E1D53A8|nr:ovomucoid-like [Mercenaria mercenaria]